MLKQKQLLRSLLAANRRSNTGLLQNIKCPKSYPLILHPHICTTFKQTQIRKYASAEKANSSASNTTGETVLPVFVELDNEEAWCRHISIVDDRIPKIKEFVDKRAESMKDIQPYKEWIVGLIYRAHLFKRIDEKQLTTGLLYRATSVFTQYADSSPFLNKQQVSTLVLHDAIAICKEYELVEDELVGLMSFAYIYTCLDGGAQFQSFLRELIEKAKEKDEKALEAFCFATLGVCLYRDSTVDQKTPAEFFEQAIHLYPKYSYSFVLCAKVAMEQQKYALAKQYLDAAVKANATDYEALSQRGYTHVAIGKIPEAYEDFKQSININPNSIENYMNMAFHNFVDFNDTLQGIVYFNSAMAISQNKVEQSSLEETLDTFMNEFNLHTAQNPRIPFTREKSLRALLRASMMTTHLSKRASTEPNGLKDAIFTVYNDVIKKDPSCAEAYYLRALFHYHYNQRLDSAIDDITTVINMIISNMVESQQGKTLLPSKEISMFYLLRAQFTWAKLVPGGHNDAAYEILKRDLDKAIELDPKNSTAYIIKGQHLSMNLHKYRDALYFLDKGIELSPYQSYTTYMMRGTLLTFFHLFERALMNFTIAIDLNNSMDPQLFVMRSKVFKSLNLPEHAKRDEEEANRLASIHNAFRQPTNKM